MLSQKLFVPTTTSVPASIGGFVTTSSVVVVASVGATTLPSAPGWPTIPLPSALFPSVVSRVASRSATPLRIVQPAVATIMTLLRTARRTLSSLAISRRLGEKLGMRNHGAGAHFALVDVE